MDNTYEEIDAEVNQIIQEWDKKEEAPQSTLSEEEALKYGMLQPEENVGEGGNPQQSASSEETPNQEQPTAERQYEKLGFWESQGDMLSAVGTEALHFFQPKSLETQYQARTEYANNMKNIYRYGVGTAAFIGSMYLTGGATAVVGGALGASKAVQLGLGLSKLAKGVQVVNTTKLGLQAARAGKSVKAAITAGNAINGVTSGLIADVLASWNLARPEENEGHFADVFGQTDNKLLSFFQTQEGDSDFDYRLKEVVNNVIAGIPLGAVIGGASAGIAMSNPVRKFFRGLHKTVNAATEEEATEGLLKAAEGHLEMKSKSETYDLINTVQDLRNQSAETGEEISQLIRDKFEVPTRIEQADKVNQLIEAGEDIFVHDDGTFDIKVSSWEDAYKVSPDEYKKQLAAVDNANGEAIGTTAINHQDEAIKSTWTNRGWMGENESLINVSKTGETSGNTKLANKITKNYKDKWQIDNNIKVEFVDGLTINGEAIEGNTSAANYLGKNKKPTKAAQTKIDKKKLEIQNLQDQITMEEGGNAPVTDKLDVLKEKLRIAENELKDLQNIPQPEKIKDITIKIDKNAKNPYATLRAELEHARDIAKGEVPNQKVQHFSRYKGVNEADVASGYTHKKSTGRYNALNPDNPVKATILDDLTGEPSTAVKNSGDVNAPNTTKTAVKMDSDMSNPQQLSFDFSEPMDVKALSTNVAKGEASLTNIEDVQSVINHIVSTDIEISGKTFKDVAEDANSLFSKEMADRPMEMAVALSKRNPQEIDMYVREQLAAVKLLSALKDLQMNATSAENINIMTAAKGVMAFIDNSKSRFGAALNYQKVINKAIPVFGNESLSDLAMRGIKNLVDIFDVVSLNFTRNTSFKEFKANLFNELKRNPSLTNEIFGNRQLFGQINEAIEDGYKALKAGKKVNASDLFIKVIMKNEADTCGWYAKLCDSTEGFGNVIKNWGSKAPTYVINNVLGFGSALKNIASGVVQTNAYPFYKIIGGLMTADGEITKQGIDQWLSTFVTFGESMRLAKQAFLLGDGLLTTTKEITEGGLQKSLQTLSKASDLFKLQNLHSFVPRLMMASDELVSQLNYRNIVRSKALAQARRQQSIYGDFAQTADEIFKQNAFSQDGLPLDFEAFTEAKDMLFQVPLNRKMFNPSTGKVEETGIAPTAISQVGQWLQEGTERFVPLKIFMPFIKTPVNIADQAAKLNPLLNNPLWQALSKGKQNEFMSSNPEIRAKAYGKMGTMIMLGTGFALAAANGMLTGSAPLDKKEKTALYKTGWRPYSMKVGDKYLPYMGLFAPLDSYMAFCADNIAFHNRIDVNGQVSLDEMGAHILGLIMNDYIDQAGFRSNTAKLMDIFNPSTDVRVREQLAANTFSSFLPMVSNVKSIRSLGKQEVTKPEGFYANLVNNYTNIFVNPQDFKRDVFGNRVDQYGILISKMTDDNFNQPEYQELGRLAQKGYTPNDINTKLKKTGVKLEEFKSVDNGRSAADAMYEELNTLKINGKTLQESVAELVQSPRYQSLNDGINDGQSGIDYSQMKFKTKVKLLNDVFLKYGNRAKKNVINNRGDEFIDKDGRTMKQRQLEILDKARSEAVNKALESDATQKTLNLLK